MRSSILLPKKTNNKSYNSYNYGLSKKVAFDFHAAYFFRYDARDPGSNATSWSEQPPRGFGDRAHFDPSLVKLSVNHIQAHEGGFYRCRVDFQRSQTQNVLVNLTVIGNSK